LDTVFDKSNYEQTLYNFYGTGVRTLGAYYMKPDIFVDMTPKFETNFTMRIPSQNIIKTGQWVDTITNGYDPNNINPYLYRVTNYGHHPQPSWSFINNLQSDKAKILIIEDSLFMRGSSFMASACSNVTIVDPRYDNGMYLSQLVQDEHWDAVIHIGYSTTGFDLTKLTTMPDVQTVETDEFIMDINGVLQYVPFRASKYGIPVPTSKDRITINGWAVDSIAKKPLSSLWLQIGDKVVKCNYGQASDSLASYFSVKAYNKCKFEVNIPTAWAVGQDSVTFYLIGFDGTYQLSEQTYKLVH